LTFSPPATRMGRKMAIETKKDFINDYFGLVRVVATDTASISNRLHNKTTQQTSEGEFSHKKCKWFSGKYKAIDSLSEDYQKDILKKYKWSISRSYEF